MITALREQVPSFEIKNISLPRREYCITALALLTLAGIAAAWQYKKRPTLPPPDYKPTETRGRDPLPKPIDTSDADPLSNPVANTTFLIPGEAEAAVIRIRDGEFAVSLRKAKNGLRNHSCVPREGVVDWAKEYQLESQKNSLLEQIRTFNEPLTHVYSEQVREKIAAFNQCLSDQISSISDEMLRLPLISEICYHEGERHEENAKRLDILFENFYSKVKGAVDLCLKDSPYLLSFLERRAEVLTLSVVEILSSELILLNNEFDQLIREVMKRMHEQISENYGKNFVSFRRFLLRTEKDKSLLAKVDSFQKLETKMKLAKMSSSIRELVCRRYEVLCESNRALIQEWRHSENFESESRLFKNLSSQKELSESEKSIEHWAGKIRDELNWQAQLFVLLGKASELRKILTTEKTLFLMRDVVWMQLKACRGNSEILEMFFSTRKEQFFQALLLINPNGSEDIEAALEIIEAIGKKFWEEFYAYASVNQKRNDRGVAFTKLLQKYGEKEEA